MPKKPRLLLLDAVAVIAAHQQHAWEPLVQRFEVVVPAVVADEAHFYEDPAGSGRRIPIDLSAAEAAGSITVVEVAASEIAALLAAFTPSFAAGVHAGEAEALAYLRALDDNADVRLVTSDRQALYAAALLGLAHRTESLAEAFHRAGITKHLPRQHGVDFHRACIREGQAMRIRGEGLAR
jgi:hypothetical protein